MLIGRASAACQMQHIKMSGYADSIGSTTCAVGLSSRRAQPVVKVGVAPSVRGTAISAEEVVGRRDVSSNALVECLALNRRVEISSSEVRWDCGC